jgi:hypothetical protein
MEYNPGYEHTLYDSIVSNAHSVGLKLAFITPYATTRVNVAAYAPVEKRALHTSTGSPFTHTVSPMLLLAQRLSRLAWPVVNVHRTSGCRDRVWVSDISVLQQHRGTEGNWQ